MNDTIQGIHHITAIASNPQRNLDFYTGVLGLRFVKRTVNFDDPGTYHFYFGDETGTPGTILTFFPWMDIRGGRRGTGQVGITAFSIPQGSLEFWQERLSNMGISAGIPFSRFDEQVLALTDPDGLLLELVARPNGAAVPGWDGGPVPSTHAIRGFAAPTLLLSAAEGTIALLSKTFGMKMIGQKGTRYRYAANHADSGVRGELIDIEVRPGQERGRNGAGVVHHIALRAENDETQLAWREKLVGQGFDVTPVLDRKYFHSIYFREPGGVLFEIATDAPGFTVDEPLESLGETLRLPPWFEAQRGNIESALPVLKLAQENGQK